MFLRVTGLESVGDTKYVNVNNVVSFNTGQTAGVFRVEAVIGGTNFSDGGANLQTATIVAGLADQAAADAALEELLDKLGVLN